MTVHELIRRLTYLNGDIKVLVDDIFEGQVKVIEGVETGHWDNDQFVVWLRIKPLP